MEFNLVHDPFLVTLTSKPGYSSSLCPQLATSDSNLGGNRAWGQCTLWGLGTHCRFEGTLNFDLISPLACCHLFFRVLRQLFHKVFVFVFSRSLKKSYSILPETRNALKDSEQWILKHSSRSEDWGYKRQEKGFGPFLL